MKYELTKDLETGNATIDREHRELFAAVNRLMDACSVGKGRSALDPAVKFLIDYVNKHFAHEEEFQKKYAYPGYPAHHTFHENYKRRLNELVSTIPAAGPSLRILPISTPISAFWSLIFVQRIRDSVLF